MELYWPHLNDPAEASAYKVYTYHHLDDLSFTRRPAEVYADASKEKLEEFIAALKDRLELAGWEGDGELGLIWFPPFTGAGVEDTYGTLVWCVKQSNNGTAFIASSVPLPFPSLSEQ